MGKAWHSLERVPVAGGAPTTTLEGTTPTSVTFRGFERYAAEGPDGSLYIAEGGAFVVRRLWPDVPPRA